MEIPPQHSALNMTAELNDPRQAAMVAVARPDEGAFARAGSVMSDLGAEMDSSDDPLTLTPSPDTKKTRRLPPSRRASPSLAAKKRPAAGGPRASSGCWC